MVYKKRWCFNERGNPKITHKSKLGTINDDPPLMVFRIPNILNITDPIETSKNLCNSKTLLSKDKIFMNGAKYLLSENSRLGLGYIIWINELT